jgi:thiosulfate/3-mercaptopyruvate sulfurtransferase
MIDFSANSLVETAWLAEHLSDDDVCIVDARWRGDLSSSELYRHGHLPGAIHLDWYHDLSWTDARGVRNLLLPPEPFTAVMEAVGIGDQTRVVVYAETDHSGAARIWWALRFYGHDQVAVLNGGWTKWVVEGRSVSSEVPQPVQARFTPRPLAHLLATAREIEQALHLHASRLLNPTDWTYLPPESIRSLAGGAGLELGQRVITYCGVGISASQGLFALHLAGYRNVALYDASWEEWGTDPTYPVERDHG